MVVVSNPLLPHGNLLLPLRYSPTTTPVGSWKQVHARTMHACGRLWGGLCCWVPSTTPPRPLPPVRQGAPPPPSTNPPTPLPRSCLGGAVFMAHRCGGVTRATALLETFVFIPGVRGEA